MNEQDIATLILAAIVGLDRLVASVSAAIEAYEDHKAAKAPAANGSTT